MKRRNAVPCRQDFVTARQPATLLFQRSNTKSPSLFDSQTAELRVVGGKTRSGARELKTCFVSFRTAFLLTIDTTHCPLVQCVWSAGQLERNIFVLDPVDVEWLNFRTSCQRRRKWGKKRSAPVVSTSEIKRNYTQNIVTIQLLIDWLIAFGSYRSETPVSAKLTLGLFDVFP